VQQARTAEIAFCGPPCTQITQVNPHRDETCATARLFVDVLDVIDRTRHSMCFFESPASVMTADGGRLYASFQDKCTHVGYVVHTYGMNARQYGSIENRHRIFFGLVRSDIHDKLGPMTPPMPTNAAQADMHTMREALLPADLSPSTAVYIPFDACCTYVSTSYIPSTSSTFRVASGYGDMGPPACWRGAGTGCKRGFPPRRGAGRSQGQRQNPRLIWWIELAPQS
jgi:hypothetical protein